MSQVDGLVTRGRHDELAVWRECDRLDPILMTLERRLQQLPRLSIPESDGFVI